MRREADVNVAPRPVIRRDQLVVFFDGACGLCTGLRETVARFDLLRRLCWIPLQTPNALRLVGLTEAEALATPWALRRDGQLVHGVDTLAAIADALVPAAGIFSRLISAEVIRSVLDPLFTVLSDNRYRVSSCDGVRPKAFLRLHPKDEAALSARMPRLDVRRVVRREPAPTPA